MPTTTLESDLLGLYLPIKASLSTEERRVVDTALYCGSDGDIEDALNLCREKIDQVQREYAEREAGAAGTDPDAETPRRPVMGLASRRRPLAS